MYTSFPYIYEGEILVAQPARQGERNIVRYTCRVEIENGSHIIVPNVQESSIFGGLSDYMRRRSRASEDKAQLEITDDRERIDAMVGERVYIAFVHGNVSKPVILSYAQHPNQGLELPKGGKEELQLVGQYHGIRWEIDEKGQMRFIHKGAPEVNFAPQNAASKILASNPLEAIGGNNNSAITPQSDENVTLWEFLDGGVFRIRDSVGQIIEINRTVDEGRIYISNNDLKSTEDADAIPLSGGLQFLANATDAEYIWLDRKQKMILANARKMIQLYSFDQRKDVTEGDHEHTVFGNSTWNIGGDEEKIIAGSRTKTVLGDDKLTVGGNVTQEVAGNVEATILGNKAETVLGNVTQDVLGNITISALGTVKIEGLLGMLKLGNGMVGIGGPAAELLQLCDQELDALISSADKFVFTLVGPGVLNPEILAKLTIVRVLLNLIKGGIV